MVYNDLRLAGKTTDAVIVAEGVEFKVHKLILCDFAQYFRNLFTNVHSSDQEVFIIPGISAEILKIIIEYVYTNSLNVTENNVLELLLASNQLGLYKVVHACCVYVEGLISPENCIGLWSYTATVCRQPVLNFKIYQYILQHFELVALCNEFLHLSAEELAKIIEEDNLVVRKESLVFEAILRWISHYPANRKTHFSALLSKVRLALLDSQYIKDNVKPSIMLQGQQLLYLLSIATRTKIVQYFYGSSLNGISNPCARPRLPTAILLAFGGWSGISPTNGIEAYDVRANLWLNVTDRSQPPRAYQGTALLNGFIYSIGGFNKLEYFNSVCKFDPITRNWQEVAPMHYRRCYVSMTVLNSCIYAMGGYNGITRLRSAEYYRPEINQWSLIAAMNEQRSDAHCTTLNNKIYICGGFNGHSSLQTAECYSLQTGQWTMITPMIRRRSGIRVIAHAGLLYAVGGFDGSRRLRSVEVFNPDTYLWRDVASMIRRRSNFGIGVVEGRLYVAGGFNGLTTCNNVECYDADTNRWSEVCSMGISRSALSCCVITGLPNMADYVIPRCHLPLLPVEQEESYSFS
ncbi:kelch-like protein 10 [Cyprinodon tularosa]|uniref:kelch-like protein 10 n=1 Tax=Cyprinodon tularosa TaxID=77115 RepID=UPI0018E2335D|nr:kelch-like protein 10 [Cyprinodon tularosa]